MSELEQLQAVDEAPILNQYKSKWDKTSTGLVLIHLNYLAHIL